ncbi:MAG: GNAT family N-acetyltransferase [Bacillota bacterium]|nr:GNAT family N-acetyltransferase [Bacillota bacterium]
MIQIRSAEIKDTDSIVNILNKVTLHLHKKGINQWDYPWSYEKIEKDINSGHVYVISAEDLIIGTFSIKNIDKISIAEIEKGSKYLYRIGILPEYQGKNAGIKIINYTFEYSRKLNKSLYLDCWAGNEKLKSFYKNAGFDYLGDFPEGDYFISVFMFK